MYLSVRMSKHISECIMFALSEKSENFYTRDFRNSWLFLTFRNCVILHRFDNGTLGLLQFKISVNNMTITCS